MATQGEITLLARMTALEMTVTRLLLALPDDVYEAIRADLLQSAPTNSIRGVDAAMSDLLSAELQQQLGAIFVAAERLARRG